MINESVKFTLLVRGADHKPLKSFPIRVQYAGETKQLERMTDQQGKAQFSLEPNRLIDVLVLTLDGSFEKNATINTTKASKKPFTIIGVGHKKSDFIVQLQIKMIDLNKKPVSHHNLEIILEGNTSTKKSDQSGIIKQVMLVGELIRMNCIDLESNLTLVEKFKKTLHVDEYPSSYTFTPNRAGDQPIIITLPMHVHDSSTEPDKPTTQHPPLTPPIQSCGIQLRNLVKCTRYNHGSAQHPNFWYGPLYGGTLHIADFNDWNSFISTNVLTQHEKDVICIMSPNEGKFDTVQSYDRVILTVGAMQKTIMDSTGTEGTGELSTQLNKFKIRHPDLFQAYLGNCGWDVKNTNGVIIVSYAGCQDQALKSKLREGCSSSTFGHTFISPAIESMANAASLKEYIKIQVEDFIERLRLALNKTPKKNHTTLYDYPISSYLKSVLGHAAVLDQDVNAPAWVSRDFGKALNHFFESNPTVSQNPNVWGSQSSVYEREIINYYGVNRGGTDMVNRFHKLQFAAGTL